MISWFIQMDGE